MQSVKVNERWTPRQAELLTWAKQSILESPEKYRQSVTLYLDGDNCVTAACIGGWIHYLSGCRQREHDRLHCAANSLGLDRVEENVLFSSLPVEWPYPFGLDFNAADSGGAHRVATKADQAKALVAARYIDFILATGRVEEEP